MTDSTAGTPSFSLGPSFWALMNLDERQAILRQYRVWLLNTLRSKGIALLEGGGLDVIIMAALEACNLLFTASLHEPARAELLDFFDEFVRRAMEETDSYVN